MIHINNISFCLPNSDRPILSQINYQIEPGDFIILLGSNGSGKSTLLKILNQQYKPTQGSIEAHHSFHTHYLTQNYNEAVFNTLTVFENYCLVKACSNTTRKSCENYLSQYNPNLAKKLNQLVAKLSGGEKQALALALIMIRPPEILLLDEHTSALDPKTGNQFMSLTNELITQNQITCILATHDLDLALSYGNQIVALKQGKVHQIFNKAQKSQLTRTDLITICY